MGQSMKGKIPKGMTVDQWVETLPPETKAIVKELRAVIRRAVPQARELIKYSWPWYYLSKPIAAIMVAGGHVNLELYRGAELKPAQIPLEGTGKSMRHLKIFKAAEVKKLPVADLIREAAELEAAGK
ncbi:MAG: DUF1801 domain-containing protein [Candidatus Aminicenantes bacterium]|nr:DUF1801 domain-containing protein [Candidatus Aminicenantes bacterium]